MSVDAIISVDGASEPYKADIRIARLHYAAAMCWVWEKAFIALLQ